MDAFSCVVYVVTINCTRLGKYLHGSVAIYENAHTLNACRAIRDVVMIKLVLSLKDAFFLCVIQTNKKMEFVIHGLQHQIDQFPRTCVLRVRQESTNSLQ